MSDWKTKLVEARMKWFKINTRGFVAKDQEAQTWVCCGRFWVNYLIPGQIKTTFDPDWELDTDSPSTQGSLEGILDDFLTQLVGPGCSYSVERKGGDFVFSFNGQEIQAASKGQTLVEALLLAGSLIEKKKEEQLKAIEAKGYSIHNADVARKMTW